jgi:NADH:ubiquinone oxidoreductase subunit 4 (subunit M)
MKKFLVLIRSNRWEIYMFRKWLFTQPCHKYLVFTDISRYVPPYWSCVFIFVWFIDYEKQLIPIWNSISSWGRNFSRLVTQFTLVAIRRFTSRKRHLYLYTYIFSVIMLTLWNLSYFRIQIQWYSIIHIGVWPVDISTR